MSKNKAQPFSIRRILPYACHEAGHAVVGRVIGRLIEEVSILPDRELGYKGYYRFSDFIESANDCLQWQRGSGNPEIVTILYAGPIAMEIICRKCGWNDEFWWGCEKADLDAIDQWCRELFADDEQCSVVKETGLAQARDLLIRYWSAVDVLAAELVVHEQVAGGEAHRIIRHTLGETALDWRLKAWSMSE
jgi:hypothetical protein